MANRALLLIIALFIGILMSPTIAHAGRQFDFKEITLDNGLRVITLEDFSCPIVAAQVWYHVGSKNEDPERQGFAHMFEHMMFRGTDVLAPEQHAELIRLIGGYANAFTSFDYTAYVNSVPANQLALALWLEAERMMFLNIDQDNFDTERKVVEEERRQDLNEPYGTVFEQIMPVVFRTHPYRWLPIGKIAHLRAASLEELRAFWDTFYVPNNAALVIVGAVKHRQARKLARRYFDWMPACPQPPRVALREPPQEAPRSITIQEPIGPAPLVRYLYRGAPRDHADYIPLQLLMAILGEGESSRLYQDLVKNQQICQEAYTYVYGLEQDGMVGAEAALMPGGDLEGTLAEIDRHLVAVLDEPVSERELTKVKNQLRRDVVTSTLTVVSKAQRLGRTTLIHGDPNWLNNQLTAIEAVTREDLQRVAKTYLAPERRTTARVVPAGGDARARPVENGLQAAAQSVLSNAGVTNIKAAVARPAGFPAEPPLESLLEELPEAPIVERTLKNGLRVVVVPNHEVPFVTVKLGLKYGSWAENPTTPGVASMTLAMLTQGTERYSAAELAEKLEFNALTLSGSADIDVATVNATALSDKLPLAIELLAEVVLRPTFPQKELEVLKGQRQLNLSIKAKDPRYLAERALRRQLFGDHSYSRTAEGELEDVGRLTVGALKQWWNTYVRPEQAVLYVAGDVKPRKVGKVVQEHLGGWKVEGSAPAPALPPIPSPQDTHIYLVDKPGAVQSQIRLGQVSITRGHPDYHASRVFSYIYGGSPVSRLNKVIRVQKGLTYATHGAVIPRWFSGTFWSYTFTKTETTAETVQALLDVVYSMRTNPPTEEDLAKAKSFLVGSFARQLETPSDIVDYQWLIDYYDLPKDYLQQALAAYKATEVDDIQRIARDVVDTDKLTIVVAGDAEAIKDSLEKIAPVTLIEAPSAEATPAAA